jgi:replication factor A1
MGGGAGGAQAIRPDEIKTIGQVKDDNIGTSDKTEYFSTRATINFVKHETFSYPACPTEGCNKKVVEEGDGWRCEKCDRTRCYVLNNGGILGETVTS